MKISVTNLGAIKEATVEVGGLTVFVGQNSCIPPVSFVATEEAKFLGFTNSDTFT